MASFEIRCDSGYNIDPVRFFADSVRAMAYFITRCHELDVTEHEIPSNLPVSGGKLSVCGKHGVITVINRG